MHRDESESGCIGLGRGVVGKWEMTDNEYWVSFGVSESHSVVSNSLRSTDYGILQARIMEWVAFPFSRGSSQPRDQTQASHIASGFFTS